MPADPFTPAELEAGAQAILAAGHCTRPVYFARAVLAAVLPRHAERIARAIEAEADAYNARIAAAAGVPNRDRDGMVSSGIRRAAAIARAHATTPGDHHAAS